MIGDDDENAWLECRVDSAILAEGAAADSADDTNNALEGLPRILRHALLARLMDDDYVCFRLAADIDEMRSGLAQSKAWSSARSETTGLALAAELSRLGDDGRFWDSLFGLLEPETGKSDPALHCRSCRSQHSRYLAKPNAFYPLHPRCEIGPGRKICSRLLATLMRYCRR